MLATILFLLCSVQGTVYSPEQIHLAWMDSPTSMSVTWASEAPSTGASVEYTQVSSYNETVHAYSSSSPGAWVTFPNNPLIPSILQRQLHVCKANMTNLTQGGLYAYRVGSNVYGWSPQYIFQAKRNYTDNELVKFIVYGDLSSGIDNVETILRLEEELRTHQYDAILHDGDFAYDFNFDSGTVGDLFLNNIQPLASMLPYMAVQGNHEVGNAKFHYVNRFTMPGDRNGLWYSFNAGRAHFLVYSTEQIFDDVAEDQAIMMEFLESDLASYDRKEYPWLIVLGHRPLYCSPDVNNTRAIELGFDRNGDCIEAAEAMRNAFEDLWYDNKVDLVISAHVHAYERLGPVYQNESMACQIESENVCINSPTPIYPVTGVPGNDESYDPVSTIPLPFSKAQDGSLGFSRLTVFNETHLLWEQVRSLTFEVSDYLWLIKGYPSQIQALDQ